MSTVSAGICKTNLCSDQDRTAALGVLVSGGPQPQLTEVGKAAAVCCGHALLEVLADDGPRGGVSYRYRLNARLSLRGVNGLEESNGDDRHAMIIIRDAVYACAVLADRATVAGLNAADKQQNDLELDAGEQTAWCERVGGWAVRSFQNVLQGQLERNNVRHRPTARASTTAEMRRARVKRKERSASLRARLDIMDSLLRPDSERRLVSPINKALDRGKLTWPTQAMTAAFVASDSRTLSLLTTAELVRRGDQFYNFLLSQLETDKRTTAAFRRAVSQAYHGFHPSRLLLPKPGCEQSDIGSVCAELMRKMLRVRLRWYLEECAVRAEDAGYYRSSDDHATHMDLILAISMGA